jgi:hypothetical protein
VLLCFKPFALSSHFFLTKYLTFTVVLDQNWQLTPITSLTFLTPIAVSRSLKSLEVFAAKPDALK